MKYFYIVLWYRPRGMSAHIIKAPSIKKALEIREKYSIANPIGNTKIKKIECRQVDMRFSVYKSLLERRRKGLGGYIWYEEDNELKTEIDASEGKI